MSISLTLEGIIEARNDIRAKMVAAGQATGDEQLRDLADNLNVTGGGHTIEDPEGTALTQRDTLQFGGDLEVSDDDENEKTVVTPHELTAAELAEIVTPLPSVPVNMPILFDESGAEYQIGWYKYANGTKKPVYEKTVNCGNLNNQASKSVQHNISNIDTIIDCRGFFIQNLNGVYYYGQISTGRGNSEWVFLYASKTAIGLDANSTSSPYIQTNINYYVTLQYTKTTDTPV